MSDVYEGRLELTWTNKAMRLLADEEGDYEWLPPSDYRVAEVRLLRDRRRDPQRAPALKRQSVDLRRCAERAN